MLLLILFTLPFSYAATSLNSCTTISSPGVYYLTTDIWNSSSTCFNITTSNVILDCQWHMIDGNKTEETYGVYASGSLSNISIRNCEIQEFYHGIYFDNGVHDSKIENVVSKNNDWYGIYLSTSSYNTLEDITANNNDWHGIVLSGSSSNTLTNITVNNNDWHGIELSGSSDNILTDIIAQENRMWDIMIEYPSSCSSVIINAKGSGNRPIMYYNSPINISNKIFSELILCNADCSNFTNITIKGSDILNNNGILIVGTNNSTLRNIDSRWNRDGIRVEDSSYNKITNIFANNNRWYGLYLWESSYNKMTNISANNNHLTGISFLSDSSYNIITNISANNNGIKGIYFWSDSSQNILTNSIISYNRYGIYLYSTDNNFFYNNLLNNTNNIYISSSSNHWNTSLQLGPNIVGRPFIGGNVYATPSGNGYSETCDDANHDGICDSPYTIASGNVDYYPLALSKTYPLNPKIYVGEQLVWKHEGFFNESSSADITSYILGYINNKCFGIVPCIVPITYRADSHGGIITSMNISGSSEGYKVRIRNILSERAGIKNITIYSNDYKKVCYTNLSKVYVLHPGGIGIFRIPCNILCNEIKDIIVETTCGVKDKLSDHPIRNKILRCY